MTSHGGASAETVAQSDPNLLEATVSQGHTYHYYPPNAGSVTTSWPVQTLESQITQNGSYSNVSYHYNPHKEMHSTNAQEGANSASISYVPPTSQQYNPHKEVHSTNVQDGANSASISYLPPTSQAEITSQAYPTNSTYSASASSYGYSNTGYSGYYNAYQQQPTQSYSQPAVGYQSQNTGAPYQLISSFQNTGSYAGTPSYSSTYYNPGHYQTYGGYTENGYNPGHYQGNFSNYNEQPQQHPTYNQDSGGAYSSSSVAPTVGNYQQQNKQWADYYSPTEVTCAPGTENKTVTSTSTLTCPIPGAPAGYAPPVSQPQESYIPWKPDSGSSTSAVQTGVAVGTHDSYWQPGSQGYPSLANCQPPHSANSSFVGVQEWQQSAEPQGPFPPFNGANQVTAITHQPLQPLQSTDTRRVSKLQIPTNPRIASNIALGLAKSDKDSSPAIASVKPAYVSVSLPKPCEKTPSSHGPDTDLKPGVFPASLRGYVERALARCKGGKQLVASQEIMKEMITKATAEGTLHSRNWDMEPLFPLPDAANNESLGEVPVSSLPKLKRSPTRRTKSRWEPMPEEKLVDNAASTSHNSTKFAGWAHFNGRDKKVGSSLFSGAKSESKGSGNSKFSFYEPATHSKSAQRPFKRQRFGKHNPEIDNASSDSDQEKGLTAYYSGAMALASSPEEKKKRESRSKRFEKVNGQRKQVDHNRVNTAGTGNTCSRRATAFVLSKNFEDNSPGAVEDFDLDALTVKGTCQEIEKRYLRLTSAPDPATVRPEEVLEKALLMVQNSQKNYLYKCDQLKSIRQDLTVQRIRNELTVKVYETHARLALEFGDLPEFNQCQSQLKFLYGEGIAGCHMEFSAYTLLSVILHSNYNRRELLSSMARLPDEVRRDEAVKHALTVRQAVNAGNYVVFFRLYKSAPNLNTCLMDLYVEKIRFQAVQCMSKAYRPTVPVSYIAHALGFSTLATVDEGEEKGVDGLEDCIEWLKAHGACLVSETNGDVQLDAKASSSSLYMPEPEDAVAHGDANLAVNDFFTQAST